MSKYRQPGFLETVMISLGKGLWFLISYPFKALFGKKKSKFNKAENLAKWLEIEKLLDSHDEIHAEQAVVRADKFFDNNLKIAGAIGTTFADKLRDFENHFDRTVYQRIWDAHKLRNQITHDVEHKPTISDCENALNKFKKGLENLGAL